MVIFLLLLGLSSTSNKSESFITLSFSESSCVIGEIVLFSLLSVGVDELELSSIAFLLFFLLDIMMNIK
ncbi:hypothetical protein H8356DRAFT_1024447 [Neocallimastix lanati (nom. inval.)]|nr:hypothetical protein H8356DRAFT_1024447 [Neocallimastix sp. JGI-2020a]